MWTTIGARLLNLFLRNLVCVGTLKSFRFLVGGGWYTDSSSGLWYWSFREDSGAYGVVGARLLSLIMGLDVYECCFAMSYVLVGGRSGLGLPAGLWCWTMNNTSSNVAINLGARLIILRYLLWDLMCFVLVFFSLYILLLLSAVDMIMVYRLACGIGIAGRTRVVLTLTSVLDLLYSKYTLRDLVCWLGLY